MDLKEFREELEKLSDEYSRKKQELQQKYVESNTMFKVGDFIENVCGIIKVDEVGYSTCFDIPRVVYRGNSYRKEKGRLIKTKQKAKKALNEYGNIKKVDLEKWKI